jgi:hypothetical protein
VNNYVAREFVERAEIARKNALRRDKGDQVTKAVDSGIKEGDVVSHGGVKWDVIELHGELGHPVTATIGYEGGKQKRVKFAELRRLATALPVKLLPKKMHVGDMVFWVDDTDSRCGGTVVEVGVTEVVILAREQDSGIGKNWYPTWVDEEGTVLRRAVCPEGMVMNLVEMHRSRIDLVGKLTAGHRVEDSTWRAMQSLHMV